MKNNHSQEEIDVIVNGWKVPSYNLVKELDPTRLNNGRKTCEYIVMFDKEGWIEKLE